MLKGDGLGEGKLGILEEAPFDAKPTKVSRFKVLCPK